MPQEHCLDSAQHQQQQQERQQQFPRTAREHTPDSGCFDANGGAEPAEAFQTAGLSSSFAEAAIAPATPFSALEVFPSVVASKADFALPEIHRLGSCSFALRAESIPPHEDAVRRRPAATSAAARRGLDASASPAAASAPAEPESSSLSTLATASDTDGRSEHCVEDAGRAAALAAAAGDVRGARNSSEAASEKAGYSQARLFNLSRGEAFSSAVAPYLASAEAAASGADKPSFTAAAEETAASQNASLSAPAAAAADPVVPLLPPSAALPPAAASTPEARPSAAAAADATAETSHGNAAAAARAATPADATSGS
ncbi:testis-specific gene A8 protein [Cyclospora cayetanensis]|uniref:Testis-specific gene A8 protein n=1 Tax=Cyclospora cayetanensis TaxID=88456 RepID=A0A6P6RRV0_9EIME|nr:testis-specific gene A8 protein [Cyclospora cayetanensis]